MEPNFLLNMIFDGNPLQGLEEDVPGLSLDKSFNTGIADIPDPVQKICERAQFDLLAKREGISDASRDDPLAKTFELSPAFIKRSNARFQKMCAAIDKVLGNYPEERQQAIEIARASLSDARDEALAMA